VPERRVKLSAAAVFASVLLAAVPADAKPKSTCFPSAPGCSCAQIDSLGDKLNACTGRNPNEPPFKIYRVVCTISGIYCCPTKSDGSIDIGCEKIGAMRALPGILKTPLKLTPTP
jgi:hypothetical protein